MLYKDIKILSAIAEIIASIAVIVSLIFVIVSLNQNTAALQSINDNFLYELDNARLSDVNSDPGLAEIIVKARAAEPLGPAEELRLAFWNLRQLNMWELAFSRHNSGLMPPSQWEAWDGSFVKAITSDLPEEKWNERRDEYGEDFGRHVDAAYSDK